jgi:hypothetical protein
MVAPSAPRDARSKIPPGPEGSNGIDRCGCRGQPAGSPPFTPSEVRMRSFLPRCDAWRLNRSRFGVAARHPSAPRDARSKIPPGPEGSNGIDRCGRRGQPAGSPPFSPRFTQAECCPASRRVGAMRHTLSCRGAAATVSIDAGAEASRRSRLLSPRLTQAECCPASRRAGAMRHTLSCRGAAATVSLDAGAEVSRRGRLPSGFRIAQARCFPARRRVGAMQDTLPCRTRPGGWAAARLTRNRIWSRFSHRAAHARAVAFPAFEPGALSRMPRRTHASNSSTSTTGAGAARCPSATPPWLGRALQRRPTRALHVPIAPCGPGRALCRCARASRRIPPRPRGRRLRASPPCQAHAGPR